MECEPSLSAAKRFLHTDHEGGHCVAAGTFNQRESNLRTHTHKQTLHTHAHMQTMSDMTTLQAIRDRVAAIKGQVGFQTPPPPLSADEFGLLLQSFALSNEMGVHKCAEQARIRHDIHNTIETMLAPLLRKTGNPTGFGWYMPTLSSVSVDIFEGESGSCHVRERAVVSVVPASPYGMPPKIHVVIKDVK